MNIYDELDRYDLLEGSTFDNVNERVLTNWQTVDLLNEQDDKIKELEKQNKRVLEKLDLIVKDNQDLLIENDELKGLVIDELTGLYSWCCCNHFTEDSITKFIDQRIKELKSQK